MRILHMPVNTASIGSTTVQALRKQMIDAEGLMFATNVVQSFEGIRAVHMGNKRHPHQALLGMLRFSYYMVQYLKHRKPDLIHWYYSGSASTLNMDIQLLKALNVAGVVEWTGSDIRIPEIEFEENPYYKAVFDNGYEYAPFESLAASRARQQRFANLGYDSLAATGMIQYIQHFDKTICYRLEQRLTLSEYRPAYPQPEKTNPLIVHSPTAKVTKGTEAVLSAIDTLLKNHHFEFKLITGMPRKKALELVQQADIFLDQFVLGDRGMASLEAMAFGKPVICYIKPSLVAAYPSDLPIINANKDNLVDILRTLVTDAQYRHHVGRQSRAYVEKYHDAEKIIPQLINIYEKTIAQRKHKPNENS